MGLDRDDVDLGARRADRPRPPSSSKSRLLPLHATHRRRPCAATRPTRPAVSRARHASFLGVHIRRHGCTTPSVSATFRRLLRQAGLAIAPGDRRPRMHDLRHTFAVRTLLGWYRDGADVAGPAAAAVDLPRPRRPAARPTGISPPHPNCSRWPPTGSTHASEGPVDDRARPDPAGVLHRAADPPARTPARTRSPPTATRSGCCSASSSDAHRQARPRAGLRRPRRAADRRRSSTTSNATAATAPHPQHPAGRDPLAVSPTPPCATPNTPTSSRACSPSRPNASSRDHRHVPHRTRSTRCSPPPTAPPGSAAATTRCSLLAVQTGLRVSELTALACRRRPARHRRPRPLPRQGPQATLHAADPPTVARPARLAATNATASPQTRCSRPAAASRLSRDAVARLVAKHAEPPPRPARSLRPRHVTPHVLRHTAAMRLLHAGVDTTVIALWLGHEQVRHDPDLPPRRPRPQGTSPRPHHPHRHQPGRYRPPDALLAFLEQLTLSPRIMPRIACRSPTSQAITADHSA